MTETKADALFEAIKLFIGAEIRRALEAADVSGMVKALAPTIKAEVLAEIPKPENGKDADPAAIQAAVQQAVGALPKAEKGDKGADADAAAIAADVLERVKQGLPAVKDGEDGKSVTVDDVRPILEGEMAKSLLEIERRAGDAIQRAVDAIPKPKDGKDGLSLDTFDFQAIDGGRVLRFEARGGDVLVAREVTTAMPIDRGVYKAGGDYFKGDGVTYGGSWWLALKDAPAGSPGSSPDWRLAVKRGKDAA